MAQKIKKYTESELIEVFGLKQIIAILRKFKEILDFDSALKINSDDAVTYANRAYAYYRLKKYDDACTDYQRSKTRGNNQFNSDLEKYCSTR